MRSFKRTIEDASAIAYEEDANQVVGQVNGEWMIAHNEDLGKQAEMTGEVFEVNSSGLIES